MCCDPEKKDNVFWFKKAKNHTQQKKEFRPKLTEQLKQAQIGRNLIKVNKGYYNFDLHIGKRNFSWNGMKLITLVYPTISLIRV